MRKAKIADQNDFGLVNRVGSIKRSFEKEAPQEIGLVVRYLRRDEQNGQNDGGDDGESIHDA